MRNRKAIQSKKRIINGIAFDSHAEAERYIELFYLFKAGKIFDLSCHPVFPLKVNGKLITTYTADFRYYAPNMVVVVEDVKPKPKTKKAEKYLKSTTNWVRFRICVKLMKAINDIDVQVVYK